MKLKRDLVQEIRQHIIESVSGHPRDLVATVVARFGLSRQAALNNVKRLVDDGVIEQSGTKRGCAYSLKAHMVNLRVPLTDGLDESEVWQTLTRTFLPKLRPNVAFICSYGFTELLGNALVHSEGDSVEVRVEYDEREIRMSLMDNGIGIFTKICHALQVNNPVDAVIEIHKGKFTTEPDHRLGEGLFYVSRLFDEFTIRSAGYEFKLSGSKESLAEYAADPANHGTEISMRIALDSTLEADDVFSGHNAKGQLGEGDSAFGLSKTRISVGLMQHGGVALVSRAQGKRLVDRLEKFKEIILDFEGVQKIGQGFADELFRLFPNAHPDVHMHLVNQSESIEKMVRHVRAVGSDGFIWRH